MLLNFKQIAAIAAVCLMASPAFAQETTATLSSDGQLTGNVLTSSADKVTQVPNATVSLVSQGKVIDSVTSDASGNFSFANVHPGPYQLVGTAAGMLGSNALTVSPFVASQPVTPGKVILEPSAPQVMYDSVAAAPVAALAGGCNTCNAAPAPAPTPCNACNACNTCGGGGFGGGSFGGRLLGSARGGLLGRPGRILAVGGLIGGLASIDDDDNVVSPTQ